MDYFVKQNIDWHTYEIGVYHVSAIGVGHQDLDPKEHYGPCLRNTAYNYINKLPDNLSSKGNLEIGRILHKHVQDIYVSNHPNAVMEFPVMTKFHKLLTSLGSIDILEQFYNHTYKGIDIDIIDFKTASQYTLPKTKWDRNPTYFSQVKIYGAKLMDYFDANRVFFGKFKVIYINKHNLGTFPIEAQYDRSELWDVHKEYKERCELLHKHLYKRELPDKEPMRWCKYCKYRFRCEEDSWKSTEKGKSWRKKYIDEFSKEDIYKMAQNGDI